MFSFLVNKVFEKELENSMGIGQSRPNNGDFQKVAEKNSPPKFNNKAADNHANGIAINTTSNVRVPPPPPSLNPINKNNNNNTKPPVNPNNVKTTPPKPPPPPPPQLVTNDTKTKPRAGSVTCGCGY